MGTCRSRLLIVAAFAAVLSAPGAARAQELGYLGLVIAVAYTFCPINTMTARGQILQVSQNVELFSLLGNRFGGDGRTTFGLPDMADEDKETGLLSCIAVRGLYPPRGG